MEQGFIKRLRNLPREIQDYLNAHPKHYIPTSIAIKETSASTKVRICWDSSRTSIESKPLNSFLLKGSAEYSVCKMLVRFRENKFGVAAGVKKCYNNLHLSPEYYHYQMALWKPNLDPDEEPDQLVLLLHFYDIRRSGGLCSVALKMIKKIADERELLVTGKVLNLAYVDNCYSSLGTTEELTILKQEMPKFMKKCGFPIKTIACTGERAPGELTETTSINVVGYKWKPHTDKTTIITPKLYIGEKEKGKYTKDTKFFEGEISLLEHNHQLRNYIVKNSSLL